MNKLWKFLAAVLTVIMVIWEIIEFLAFPALVTIVGLLNSFPWQYYAITIGGYVALLIIAEIAAHFIFKALDKKYTPLIERKLEKIFNRFSKEDWLSERKIKNNLPQRPRRQGRLFLFKKEFLFAIILRKLSSSQQQRLREKRVPIWKK